MDDQIARKYYASPISGHPQRLSGKRLEVTVSIRGFIPQYQVFGTRGTDMKELWLSLAGEDVPPYAGGVTGTGPFVMNIAPDKWLVAGEKQGIETDQILGKHGVRFVDLSHSRTVFRVSGSDAEVLLSKGCSLNFDAAVFKPSTCASSLLEHTACLFHRLDQNQGFDLYIARSFAEYVWEWFAHVIKVNDGPSSP